MRIRFAVVLLAAALGCKSKRSEPASTTGSGSDVPAGVALDATTASTVVELPEVSGAGYDHADAKPDLSVTTSAVLLDGTPVATIVNGAGSPAETGGGTRAEIEPLVHALASRTPPSRFTLALDRTLTYRGLFQVMSSVGATKLYNFALLATHAGETVAVPLELPAPAEAPSAPVPRKIEKVEPSKATVSSETSLSAEGVKGKIIAAYVPTVRDCLLGTRTDVAQREEIEIGFTIDDTGHTTDVTVTGTSVKGSECLIGVVKKWMFPIPKDNELVPTPMTAKVIFDANYVAVPNSTPAAPAAPTTPPLGMTVTVTSHDVSVWSTSGLEGTSRAPLATVPLGPEAAADVARTLADVVKRRPTRGDADKIITLRVDSTVTLQVIADLLGAVRRGDDGNELFPRVQLAAGTQ